MAMDAERRRCVPGAAERSLVVCVGGVVGGVWGCVGVGWECWECLGVASRHG